MEANEVVKNLLKELGLTYGYKYERTVLRYRRIIMFKNADVDGDSIMGLVYNIFHFLFKDLLKVNDKLYYPYFFYEFYTPAYQIILKDLKNPKIKKRANYSNNIKYEFTSEFEFNKKIKEIDKSKILDVRYLKGLGAISDEDVKEYFEHLNNHVIPITLGLMKI